jgi:hypothetical protein
MAEQPVRYQYLLDGGIYLEAFSVDPNLKESDLAELISSKDGTAQLDSPSIAAIKYGGSVKKFDDLEVILNLEKVYTVPAQLKAYRNAVQKDSDAKGRFNGPLAIVEGPVRIPLKLFQGGFYDFVATKLGAVPYDLVPDKYPAGKKIADLFKEWGIDPEERARYFGFAHVMLTENGEKLSLVQRAKGMAIAPDCIAFSGSTPNPKFSPTFNFQQYCKEHVTAEIREEFSLEPTEFQLAGIHLFDDTEQAPFGALEIQTPNTTGNLAERIYGNAQAIKEHPVLYSVPLEGVDSLLKRFAVFPSNVQVLRQVIHSKV